MCLDLENSCRDDQRSKKEPNRLESDRDRGLQSPKTPGFLGVSWTLRAGGAGTSERVTVTVGPKKKEEREIASTRGSAVSESGGRDIIYGTTLSRPLKQAAGIGRALLHGISAGEALYDEAELKRRRAAARKEKKVRDAREFRERAKTDPWKEVPLPEFCL